MSAGTPVTKMTKSGKAQDDRGQNIQVFVRCRPLNQAEKNVKAFNIVDTPTHREIVVKEKPNTNLTKSYQFDRVFGLKSQQLEVYRAVVEPLIEQVMMGYNCTVFAYGQTGTGKTFTMEGGEMRNETGVSWDSDPTSGIIPRAMAQIFDTLRGQADSLEYSVRVSFLELYNEEISDLLSASDDMTRLRLYEDAVRKGSVIIQGLEEVQVHNKCEVYNILEKGSEKRKTAETLMNAHSSRSHTVFTVTVHIKEASLGEEVLRIGKLNLVDLAGSENIGRSGAKDTRAREAGNINQSLLTLGRVISCLVERAPHIPYRESKLTRLLQDSLGGRTKTSIIATVSPATINLEETLSTLDYAYRARNITNRPEVNQKLSKREVLKEYGEEMERLRRDLLTMREKNGVYIAKENYHEMLDKIEQQQKDITEKAKEMGVLKVEMEKKEKLFDEVEKCMIEKSREIRKATENLEKKESRLVHARDKLRMTIREKEEQEHLVSKHMETEGTLGQQARKLLVVSDELDQDLEKVHDKLSKVQDIEVENCTAKVDFMIKLDGMVEQLCSKVDMWGVEHEVSCNKMNENLKHELSQRREQLTDLAEKVAKLVSWQKEVGDDLEVGVHSSVANGNEVVETYGQMVSNSAEKGVAVGGNYQEKVLPYLQEIVVKLNTQADALRHLASTVKADLGKIRTKVSTAVGDIVVAVDETDLLVKKHYVENCKVIEELTQVNKDVVSSHSRLEKSLNVVMGDYQEHRQEVAKLGESTNRLAQEIRDNVTPLVSAIGSTESKVGVTSSELVTDVEVEGAEVTKKIRRSVEECMEENDGICGEIGKVKSTSEVFEIENKEVWDALTANVEKTVDTRLILVKKNGCEVTNIVEGSKDELNIQGEALKEIIKLGNSTADDDVPKMSEIVDNMVDSTKKDHKELKEKVDSLLGSELSVYQPTGNTPVRMERHFPRYLASTSPHSRILERFRKVVEGEEAARLPLDISSDSAISSQSKMSSTIGGEDSERLGSADSIYGSITSDWDKEVGNQENVELVKPKPKKRELKKPEVFPRNVLGSNSNLNNI